MHIKCLANQKKNENEKIVKTYTVDSTDLDLYETENDYDAGKKNPFSIIDSENIPSTSGNQNNGGSNNTGTGSGNNQNEDVQGNIKTTK